MTADTFAGEHIAPPRSRNDPCPCGSGKRYKQCHGLPAAAAPVARTPATLLPLMEAALAAQREGDQAEAERCYRAALAIAPDQPDCLHMLGVVRMHRLDFDEARSLIERAGAITGWTHDSYRHNYGYLLSALLSAREPAALNERREALQARRSARLDTTATGYCVAIIATAATAQQLDETLASITALSPPPDAVVVLGGNPGVAPLVAAGSVAITHAAWTGIDAAADLERALSGQAARFTVIVHAGDLAGELPQALADLAASGASWAIARCQLREGMDDPTDVLPATALRNLFALAQHASRLGAALFADGEVLTAGGNALWERDFLLRLLRQRPAHFHTLCELAVWYDEPVFVDRLALRFAHRLPVTSAFWQRLQASAEPYMALALSGEAAPNPVAPTLEFDGAAFMKRALRLGLGRRVGAATLQRIAALALRPPSAPTPLASDGVEWIGFVRAEIGLGESLRLMARACLAAEIPIALTNIPLDLGVSQSERSLRAYEVTRPTYRTRVISTNPDNLGEGNFVDGAFALPDAYNVGYWYWELEKLPPAWADFDRIIDELWVATDFVAAAARAALSKPVTKITPPILPPQLARGYRREEFAIPDGAFTFMFSFDFGSYPARKNPEAVVRAFRLAFAPERRDVRLLLKCHRGHTFPAAQAALLAEVGGDDRIVLLDRTMSRDDLTGLQSLIDCYVSLHRSEGLGLGMAECMALGKPVIATAYSGNLEFTRPENSLLVDFERVPLAPEAYLVWRDQVWAEPSIAHAAQQMRTLADDPALARRIGEAGRQTIVTEYSPRAVGLRVKARLAEINARLYKRA